VATEQQQSPHHELREKYGAPAAPQAGNGNSVQVDPGGATFPTIGAALASITDASQQKQYLLTLGPGTFDERLTLKPWCFLHGSGQDATVVTSAPTQDQWGRGTIITASNSSVANMTISCVGGSRGQWSTALNIGGSSPFYAEQVVLVSDDQGNAGINSETVAVNWNPSVPGPSQVYLAYATVISNMQSNESTAIAMIVNAANAELTESKVVAEGGVKSFGVTSNGGAAVDLYNCSAAGASFALYIADGPPSAIVATNCQIDGPVGQGVQIIDN
jgi:pectin methylesterase-like acyl-CoA thioesterase